MFRNFIVNLAAVFILDKTRRKEFRKKYRRQTKVDKVIQRVDVLTDIINKKLNLPPKNRIARVRYTDNELANEIRQYGDLIEDNLFIIGERTILLTPRQIKNIKSIEDKLISGEYKYRQNKCLCGVNDDQIIAVRDRYGSKLITVICKNCGLVRLNPYFDDSTLGKFYNNEFDNIYEQGRKDFNSDFNAKIRAGDGIINRLIANEVPVDKKRVYEIGCAGGGILKAFQNRGCVVSGCDYNAGMIAEGKLRGLDLMVGGVECFKNKPKADIVILNHVLEHVTEPIELLKNIRDIMEDDGCLYIDIPSIESVRHGRYYAYKLSVCFMNAHVWYFSQNTLRYVVNCAGLDCKVIGHGTFLVSKTSNFRDIKAVDKDEYNNNIRLYNETEKIYWDLNS